MKTEVIEHPSGVRLVISEASAKIGLYRTILSDEATREEIIKVISPDDLEKLSLRILHTVLYPAMIASVVEHSGIEPWPPSFEVFAELPEGLEAAWEKATYSLNPHWIPKQINVEEAEKKVT